MKSRVLRTLMPRKARHAVSCDTYAPTALLKCFSSILIRYQYEWGKYLSDEENCYGKLDGIRRRLMTGYTVHIEKL